MIRSYTYRLYPTKAQSEALNTMLYAHRTLYNAALEERIGAYKSSGKVFVNYNTQALQLTEIRKFFPELKQFSASSEQQTLRKLDKAYRSFFSRVKRGETPGFPRFKSANKFNSVAFIYKDGCKLANSKFRIQGVGLIKVKLHRPIPEDAKLKQVVTKLKNGKWYATFQMELPDLATIHSEDNYLGIDVGIESFLVTSDSELISNPTYSVKAQKKLRVKQRKLSRCKRRSKRRKKAVLQLAKAHEHIANQRKDFQHKLSKNLTSRYKHIAVEDLNILSMIKRDMSKSILDAGWSQFLNMLIYKAEDAGGIVVKVDPSFTSQDCSECGTRVPKALSVRYHHCPECGLHLHRDVNAALNIRTRGFGTNPETLTQDISLFVVSEAVGF